MSDAFAFEHDRIKPKDWTGQRVRYLTYKWDGYRVTLFKQSDGSLRARSRTKELTAQLECQDWFRELRAVLPSETSIDGELVAWMKPSSAVTTHLAEGLPLKFIPFAMPYLKGCFLDEEPLDAIEWRLLTFGLNMGHQIDLSMDAAKAVYGNPPTSISLLTALKAENAVRRLDTMHPVEGFVLKQGHLSGWYKFKPQRTVDCFVTGFEAGQGKYQGGVGSLKVSVFATLTNQIGMGPWNDGRRQYVEIARVSGMDDATRAAITDKDLGRVCEVEYMEVASQGRLRHPRFLRWRDDKTRSECTIDQIAPTEVP